MADCDNDNIPRGCADEFAKLSAGVSRIEMKIDSHMEMHKTLSARMWGIVKGGALILFGIVMGKY